MTREQQIDAAVRKATWEQSAFGARAELRRIWLVWLAHGIPERSWRAIQGHFRWPVLYRRAADS